MTAGRDRGSLAFELESLHEHLGLYLGFLRRLNTIGFTTWTQRLLSNAKERLLVSGMGIELLVKLFRQGPE